MTAGYSTGLLNCRADCKVCLSVLFCGWTQIPSSCLWAKSRGEKCTFWHWVACTSPVWARANVRHMRGEVDKRYGRDCCTYVWCWPCALCQDLREIKALTGGLPRNANQPMASAPENSNYIVVSQNNQLPPPPVPQDPAQSQNVGSPAPIDESMYIPPVYVIGPPGFPGYPPI
jgi:hypothetical protein